uniref:Uncharacterized protein n=1 Tax=Rhizophora mucronata TaxID=61149 RepID=A0A2P2IR47_RHIMU
MKRRWQYKGIFKQAQTQATYQKYMMCGKEYFKFHFNLQKHSTTSETSLELYKKYQLSCWNILPEVDFTQYKREGSIHAQST